MSTAAPVVVQLGGGGPPPGAPPSGSPPPQFPDKPIGKETVKESFEPEIKLDLSDLSSQKDKKGLEKYMNKGDVSNLITFVIMIVGVIIELWVFETEEERRYNFVFAFGLFGFAGGFTNWLAIKMLFERVCGLPGSGIIPMRFKEIRGVVKTTIMKAFFDDAFLDYYLKKKVPEKVREYDFGTFVAKTVNDPSFDAKVAAKLEEVSRLPEGAMLNMIKGMMGGSFKMLLPMFKPAIIAMGRDLAGTVADNLGTNLDTQAIKKEIDEMMSEKLELLTPEIVKILIEEMISEHLGWLIIWGNIFGGIIGCLTIIFKILFVYN